MRSSTFPKLAACHSLPLAAVQRNGPAAGGLSELLRSVSHAARVPVPRAVSAGRGSGRGCTPLRRRRRRRRRFGYESLFDVVEVRESETKKKVKKKSL